MKACLCRCMVVGLLLQATGTIAAAADDVPEPMVPLKVSIAIPIHHGHRSLNDGVHFHVLLTNASDKPIAWRKNYPDWLELAAGDSYVLNVDWSSKEGRWIWKNAPTADGKRKPTLVKLRAIYEVQPDDESRKSGVWTDEAARQDRIKTLKKKLKSLGDSK